MTQEALKLALEALEYMAKIRDCQREAGYPLSDADKGLQKAITAIKEALAQHDSVQAKPEPEQEPVAWTWDTQSQHDGFLDAHFMFSKPESSFRIMNLRPLYITPPQRTWVDVPDEEIKILWIQYRAALPRYLCFAKALLARAKEKSNG